MDSPAIPMIRLVKMTALGPFAWRWPEEVEAFDRGWVAVATADGQEFHVRHGIGRRDFYGRSRTRLADRDDRDHMITVARELHPARPSALDLPFWRIERGWCHPGVPDCISCPLTEVCPKDIERAAHVTSGYRG